jgi:hypothetical protein
VLSAVLKGALLPEFVGLVEKISDAATPFISISLLFVCGLLPGVV